MIQSLCIERRAGLNWEAQALTKELRDVLGIPLTQTIRILRRYEVKGLEKKELHDAAPGLLFEAPVDQIVEEPQFQDTIRILAREYLPGQFDQRADAARTCLQRLYPSSSIAVSCCEIFLFSQVFDESTWQRIVSWLINPVDSREKNLKESSLGNVPPEPEPVGSVEGFRKNLNWEDFRKNHGLAMSQEDLIFLSHWFSTQEQRDPTFAELRALDTYWSDHCRHTTFETEFTSIVVEEGPGAEEIRQTLKDWDHSRVHCSRSEKPRTLMDLATIAAREARKNGVLGDWDVSEEVNACTLRVDAKVDGRVEPWLLSFKNETHNHPTEIEPFGGASTCIGGAVRDPLSGRAFVHQALRVSGGADPRQNPSDAMEGKLPQRLIAHQAAEGYSSYGNQLGLATSVVREHYHPGYAAKRLECGAVLGASPASHVRREIPQPGDVVILVGGATGRDGIGGATGSSVAHDHQSLEKAGAEVQKGNAPEERKLQRLFRRKEAAQLIRRCNDFGAGGIAVAVGELAPSLSIDLDAVRVKYDGLDGLELALSESQERMAVVVDAEDASSFIALAQQENLDARIVAHVTNDGRLRMHWRGQEVVNLSRELLDSNGVRRQAHACISPRLWEKRMALKESSLQSSCVQESQAWNPQNLLEVLSSPEVAARRGLQERFDGSVGGTTVLSPLGGWKEQIPAEASVHLLPTEGDCQTASCMAVGFDPSRTEIHPYRGAQEAHLEALARCAAVGAPWRSVRFSLQEFFGRTDRGSQSWGDPLAALLGAFSVQKQWNLPAIGGKDSMSGSYGKLDVPPTLIAFAATAMDVEQARGASLSQSGWTLLLLTAGSRTIHEEPDWKTFEANWDWMGTHGQQIRAAASVGAGGWGGKLALMALGGGMGVELQPSIPTPAFAPLYGDVIIALEKWDSSLEASLKRMGGQWNLLGQTKDTSTLQGAEGPVSLTSVERAWRSPFAQVWGDTELLNQADSQSPPSMCFAQDSALSTQTTSLGAPRVCIPVFPGSNGEDDGRRAFQRAGGIPEEVVLRDFTPQDGEESMLRLAQSIDSSQIFFVPGGFSAGDEPDGAGKYIASVLRHPRIVESLLGLLSRNGLVLGICNGFQALLKSGWLLTSQPGIPRVQDPTLAPNQNRRHIARTVYTVNLGGSSPWLQGMKSGDVHRLPISHGEGRFSASPEALQELLNQQRIPFLYSDEQGKASMHPQWNPNGSVGGVEALLSPCGQILGKMGHSERWRKNTFIDVPGMEVEQPLIRGGVGWFL
ncbi:MAG: phosphoribosylformylglycinamidine synthase [Spirochaetales bacterium]|nr:phosphoribosylformylglycinamidine synthase [Spirochaetales bacterium]